MTSICFADAIDIRITDGDGDVLDISSSGELNVSTTDDGTQASGGSIDIRISDNNGDVLDINSDGTITLSN